RRAALEPNRGGVDRFLSERSEALPLEWSALVTDLGAEEERLQAIVDRTRQDHPAQNLQPLVASETPFDRFAPEKAVTERDQIVFGLAEPLPCGYSRRGLGSRRQFRPRDGAAQRTRERHAQFFDVVRGDRLFLDGAVPDRGGKRSGKRLLFGDECEESLPERRRGHRPVSLSRLHASLLSQPRPSCPAGWGAFAGAGRDGPGSWRRPARPQTQPA